MKVDPSAIDSPLALIALFVAIIELFLIFPIAKLQGRDRLLLVVFVIGYPVFIAGAFFVFLWNKPINLYKPQTLSESLQRALLPEGLNKQLAPDRAAVTAVELKITTLETQLRDVSQRIQASAGGGGNAFADVAKLSDLEELKADLLARAEATGDISRSGLASAAREIKKQETQDVATRIATAKSQLEKFKIWLRGKGLAILPSIPDVVGLSLGPALFADEISLGPPEKDYLVPGLYVNRVAEYQSVRHLLALVWTAADYMASRFGKIDFPNPAGPYSNTVEKRGISNDFKDRYKQTYSLFLELARTFGDNALESGVIHMMNEWNSKSDFSSSLSSIALGMSNVGADAKQLKSLISKFDQPSTESRAGK
jgi:hypothetical protein